MTASGDWYQYHNWMEDNGAIGTVFVEEDVKNAYENYLADCPWDMPPWNEAREWLLNNRTWGKELPEMLTQQGNEMIYHMVDIYAHGIGEES